VKEEKRPAKGEVITLGVSGKKDFNQEDEKAFEWRGGKAMSTSCKWRRGEEPNPTNYTSSPKGRKYTSINIRGREDKKKCSGKKKGGGRTK